MAETLNIKEIAQHMHILFITLDSLRYDVADKLFHEHKTPHFQQLFPDGWQQCSSPGSFTYAAHQAFFAGFLPTPVDNPKAPRLFAARFAGSETTGNHTLVFDTPDIVSGFAEMGFRTVCIGGVGFFNKQTALGSVLPNLFQESYWETGYGVTDTRSTQNQFEKAAAVLQESNTQQLFLFINVSAIHQPNYFYLHNERTADTPESHAAALQYVDSQLPILLQAITSQHKDVYCLVCADHGTAYGENGYYGHRVAHSSVWDVPFATSIIKCKA